MCKPTATVLDIPFDGPCGSDWAGQFYPEMPTAYRSVPTRLTYGTSVDGYRLSFVEAEFADIEADPAMFSRYTPVPGDRYMVYPDGYKSFSPKQAFEDGYTRV